MDKIVVFNALQTSLSGGIGRYSYELAKELYLQYPNQIKVVIREQDKEDFNFINSKDLIVVSGINNSKERNIYEQFKLPRLIARKYPNAILHYPDTMAPIFSKNKVVITVHDLAFKSLKDVFTWKTVLWKNLITNFSIKKASKVIAITNFTKTEISKHYPRYEKKVSVVYNGFNDFSKEEIDEANLSEKIKCIKDDYILTVSTISPRKNIDGLIKAFFKVKDQISSNLVIAGGNGWMYEEVYRLVRDLNLEKRVIFTGKINDDELKYLYKNCKGFVYPSFYEGFGLPPMEAMSYGKPCAISDIPVFNEIYKNSVLFFNPYSEESISATLVKLEYFKCNSINFYALYSWSKCAKKCFSLYKTI